MMSIEIRINDSLIHSYYIRNIGGNPDGKCDYEVEAITMLNTTAEGAPGHWQSR